MAAEAIQMLRGGKQANSALAELARSTNSDGGGVDGSEAETSLVTAFERVYVALLKRLMSM